MMLRAHSRMSQAIAGSPVLVTASVVHLTNDACFALLYPLLPFISDDLGLSYTQAGLLKAAFSGASSVLQVPAGVVGARYGEMLILQLGNAWVGAGLVGMALTGSFIFLLVAALLGGIGGNAQHPLAASIVSKEARPAQMATAMGTLNFSGDLGKLVGPFVAGVLATQFGWRVALAFVGMVTVAISASLLLRHRASATGAAPRTAASSTDEGGVIRQGFRYILLAGALDTATRGAALTFLPFVFVDRGFSAAAVSALFGVIFAAGAAGKFACGWLSDRVGILWVIVATEISTALCLLVLTGASRWLTIPLVIIFGFSLNGTSSALTVAVAQFVPAAQRARGFGTYFTVSLVASAVAPLAYGLLADNSSITIAFVVMAIMTAAVLPSILPVRGVMSNG
jgi:MFS family permease